MPTPTFKPPTPRSELPMSLLLGGVFVFVLFLAMALAQMIGECEPPKSDLTEEVVAYLAPEIEEIEEELPPPPEQDEPPPELEVEPPQLSLSQLDLALNPGTGGSIVGDFAMPTIATGASALGTTDFVDFSDLDQMPKPLPGSKMDFPRRLKKKKVSGRVVLLLKLSETGEVLDVDVESSSVPNAHEKFVAKVVKRWRFTPPTQNGNPVRARAQLPVPIRIGS